MPIFQDFAGKAEFLLGEILAAPGGSAQKRLRCVPFFTPPLSYFLPLSLVLSYSALCNINCLILLATVLLDFDALRFVVSVVLVLKY